MSTQIQRREDVIVKREGEEYLFYDPGIDSTFLANASSFFIWQLCDGSRKRDAIVGAIKERFSAPGDIGDIVDCTLEYLRMCNLLKDESAEREEIGFEDRTPSLGMLYCYVTDRCNLKCKHCWITPKWTQEVMDSEISAQDLMRFIEQGRPLGLTSVKLTGGEPLLWPHIVEFLHLALENHIQVGMETNGTLMTAEIAALLKRHSSTVSVSLDGATPETHDAQRGVPGSFDDAINGIRVLKEAGVTPQCIMSVSHENIDELGDLLDLCGDLGISLLKLNPITPMGRATIMQKEGILFTVQDLIDLKRKIAEELQPLYKTKISLDLPCSFDSLQTIRRAGAIGHCPFRNLLGVLANGNLTFCGYGYVDPSWILGNIKNCDLEDLWNNHPRLVEMRALVPNALEGVCGMCAFKQKCLGKCRAFVASATGTFTAPDPNCQRLYELGLFPESRLITKS